MVGIRKIVAILALAAILVAFSAPAAAQKMGMQTKQSTMPMQTSNKDMMATMSGMSDASMASSLMKASGMSSMMSGGSHTMFVPSDSAMKGMGMDMTKINQMMSDKTMARNTMQSFMMNSMVKPSDMTDGKKLTMMNGKTMTVKNMNGQMTLDGAKITKAVQTTNGMIYMIDSIPSSMMSMPMMSK